MGYELDNFPKMAVGSIIRIHAMAVQKWQGCLNGRVYDARSVTVVGDVNNSALASETISSNNKRDEIKRTSSQT